MVERKSRLGRYHPLLSFVAVAAALVFFALEVSAGVVDAGDLDAESVDAPADAPPPPAGRLTLPTHSRVKSRKEMAKSQRREAERGGERRREARPHLPALEEALLVTVGDVERQSQNPGRVLHALEEVVQSPPAGSLHHNLTLAPSKRFCPSHPDLTYKVRLQLIQAERREVQAAGSRPG